MSKLSSLWRLAASLLAASVSQSVSLGQRKSKRLQESRGKAKVASAA